MAHVAQHKKDVVGEFVELINKYKYIGAVNMENLPARTMLKMREQLRQTVLIRMSKRRLLKVALESSKKPGVEKLVPYLKGMPALIFTEESPFKLFKTLKKNKSSAAIKGGQVAPKDIIVPAGPTPFAPGPVIGELGAVGIKSGVDGGKVAIKADSKVASEGDVVSAALAGLLTRLGIEPMEIGLDLTAIYEDGEILTKTVLDVDETQYIADITSCAQGAFNLAVNSAYACQDTITILVQTAFNEARNLAVNEDILTDITVGDTLCKAQGQMFAVANLLSDDALSDELKGAKTATASTPVQTTNDAGKKEEKKDNDDAPNPSAGLGALFG
ncbi:MAG: 50S ribosomal protein L10 [Candidatus Woesearchaeota archaeon]